MGMICCCGRPLNGSHDHATCGPPIDEEEEERAMILRDDQRLKECMASPIFVLRRRSINVYSLPDGYDFEDGRAYKNDDNDDPDDPPELSAQELLERDHAMEIWHVESVWLSREEATAWAKAHEYNYRQGWDVYCISALGKLRDLLNVYADSYLAAVASWD